MKTLREEAITQLIISRLNQDLRTSGQQIDVSIINDDILLVGFCDTEAQRAAAEMIVRGTHGVRNVIDNIHVRKIAPSI